MDKITHQIRAEHWAKIMNECINSGVSKTAWCRANGISEKQFFYWRRILRRKAFENSQYSWFTVYLYPQISFVIWSYYFNNAGGNIISSAGISVNRFDPVSPPAAEQE